MAVLLTGATGFIAEWILDDLLKKNYDVIGTVRSQEKAERLHKQFGSPKNLTFEIVADIANPEAFDHVFEKRGKEIKVVLHTASPFHFNTTEYEKDLLIPAVNGTKGVLNAIKKFAPETVQNVVITSSFAAVVDTSRFANSDATFTEKDWNPATWENCQTDGMNAYCASKKFAEEAAWKFLEENKDVHFKLTTVNPTYVFGPQKFDEDVKEHLNTSNEIINSLLHSKPGSSVEPDCHAVYVDVRDVAKAHLIAFEKENAIGKRLGLSAGNFSSQEILDILNSDFPQLKGKISEGPAPGKGDVSPGCAFDTSKSNEILGFSLIGLEQTVHDTAAQVLKKEGRL